MAIVLTPKNSHFSKNIYWMGLPHTNLLTDAFLFGKDPASSTKNLAPYGKGNGSANGAVAYTDNSINIGSSSYILASSAVLKNNFTILAVVRTAPSGLQLALGTYDGQQTGVLVYVSNGLLYAGGELVNSSNNITHPIELNQNKYTVIGIKYNGTTFSLFSFANDEFAATAANSTANISANILRFGAPIGLTYSNYDIAFGAGYSTALTDEQLKDTYKHLKKLMTNRGITLA